MHQATLQGHQRLVWQSILWDKIGLGLRCAHPCYFNAGIHQEILAEIQALHAKSISTLSVLTVPQTVRCTGSNSPSLWTFSQNFLRRKSREIQCVVGSILYYARTIEITVLIALSSINIKQTKGTTITMQKAKQLFGLPYHQPQGNQTVPCLQHDYERAFRGILPFQIQARIHSNIWEWCCLTWFNCHLVFFIVVKFIFYSISVLEEQSFLKFGLCSEFIHSLYYSLCHWHLSEVLSYNLVPCHEQKKLVAFLSVSS
jgi:hypothetical protein